MTDSERARLLERCLRLEAENAWLLFELRKASGRTRKRRYVTDADTARMRMLRARGMSTPEIVKLTGWGFNTVSRHTRDAAADMLE